MSDIFISYSSFDREKANALAKLLGGHSHEVWMDQSGISGAQDWSSEIVEALNRSKIVIFLISKDSVTSHNCAKEIHLASEKHKNILPIVIEDTPIPVLFEFPLAGLQRVRYEQTEAILKAIEILEGGKSIMEAMLSQSKMGGGIIHLAVLPFEDQSPEKDNEWFADGMMDELINTLSSLSQLHVNPRGDVIYYKKNRPKQSEIAADLKCRYIVEGTVQKSGEKIRIRVSLSDAAEHRQLWGEKYVGTFEDVFNFQESTARKITETLKLKLAPDEAKKIEKKPTENAEAYELFLKATEYYHRATKSGLELARTLCEKAVDLDPYFVSAYLGIANACQSIYSNYIRSSALLDQAETVTKKVFEIEGESSGYFWITSMIALRRGNGAEALRLALLAIEQNPEYALGYSALGSAYHVLGKIEELIAAREEYILRMGNDTNGHFGLLTALHELRDTERLSIAADRALPVFRRHIRLNPDDYYAQVDFANILLWVNRKADALRITDELSGIESLDGVTLYNLACLYLFCNLPDQGLKTLRRSLVKGFKDIETIRRDPDLDPLRGTPEFEELVRELSEP